MRRAETSEWRWLEPVQCAHEELVAVGSDPFVDDVCAVSRDRQVDAHLVQSQRRRTRWREGKTRDARGARTHREPHTYPSRGSNHDGHRRRDHEATPQPTLSAKVRGCKRAGSLCDKRGLGHHKQRHRHVGQAFPTIPRETALDQHPDVRENVGRQRIPVRRTLQYSSRAYRGDRLPGTPAVLSTSRTAQRQTPRYRTACPPVCPVPAPAPYRLRCPGSLRRRSSSPGS